MNTIKECILEFKITYFGERLFNQSIVVSVYKSIKAMVKCFMDLLRPTEIEF